eukprot:7370842-Alexandrium_andersonii.AAC.1
MLSHAGPPPIAHRNVWQCLLTPGDHKNAPAKAHDRARREGPTSPPAAAGGQAQPARGTGHQCQGRPRKAVPTSGGALVGATGTAAGPGPTAPPARQHGSAG